MGTIPDRVKFFIFQYVDSVEFLEILILLHAKPTRYWLVVDIAQELRSSILSIETRIESLLAADLVHSRVNIDRGNATPEYAYKSVLELQATVDEIAEVYRSHRHRLNALIYSPSKNARDFAEAFNFNSKKCTKRGDGEDG